MLHRLLSDVSALEFVIGHLHLIHSHMEATLDVISGTVALRLEFLNRSHSALSKSN